MLKITDTHITQSPVWGEFRSLTLTVKKVLRVEGEKNRVFQIFFHKIPHLPYTVAYLPRSTFPNQSELEKIKIICQKEKAVFLKIEPITPSPYKLKAISYKLGKSILPQHTIYIDLTKSEEQLLSEMHEKTRYNVRLAQKKGVVAKEETSEEGLEKFIEILEKTEKRQGFYSHTPSYYRLLFKTLHPHKMIHILNAYVSTTNSELLTPNPIASIMLFHYGNFLYYPYGGSDYEYRNYMAPQLLHFEAMKLGKKLGCTTYDLWGSYKNSPTEKDPWWGFYRLKSGFGGTPIDFPNTIDIPLSPLYYPLQIVDQLRWLLLKIKSKLK